MPKDAQFPINNSFPEAANTRKQSNRLGMGNPFTVPFVALASYARNYLDFSITMTSASAAKYFTHNLLRSFAQQQKANIAQTQPDLDSACVGLLCASCNKYLA